MPRVMMISLRIVLVAVLSAIGWLKFPHAGLYLMTVCGRYDQPEAPARIFQASAPDPQDNWTAVQLGAVSLLVPRAVLTAEVQAALAAGRLQFEHEGLCFWALAPRPDGLPPLNEIIAPDSGIIESDLILLEIAAYTAGPGQFSLTMSRPEVRRLSQLLDLRRSLSTHVDHIEVIQRPDLRGLLVVRTPLDGRVWQVMDYLSADGALGGRMGFSAGEGAPEAIVLGRTVIGSVRFTEAVKGPSQRVERLAPPTAHR